MWICPAAVGKLHFPQKNLWIPQGTSEARCWPYSLSLRALTARLSGDTRSAAATKAPGAPPRDPPQRRWERSAAARARHFPSSPRGTGSPPKPCPALPCPARLAARPRPSQRDARQHRGTAARPRDILTPPAPARRRPITVATAPPFRPSRLLRGGGEPGPWRSLFGGLFLRASSRMPLLLRPSEQTAAGTMRLPPAPRSRRGRAGRRGRTRPLGGCSARCGRTRPLLPARPALPCGARSRAWVSLPGAGGKFGLGALRGQAEREGSRVPQSH